DLLEHRLGGGMGLVLQQRHLPAVVVVADHPGEAHHRTGATVGHRPLVRRHVERLPGHLDHGFSLGSSGSGTSGTSSPARPPVPGSITANPTAAASPRSIADPACGSGCTGPP